MARLYVRLHVPLGLAGWGKVEYLLGTRHVVRPAGLGEAGGCVPSGLIMDPQRGVRERLGKRTRAILVALALATAGILGLARWLEPDPRGYGTHEQLGLR